MRERTTKKQRELLDFLDSFLKANQFAPSYREIAKALEYKSVSTVAVHINNLINLGYLRKSADSARSLEIVPASIMGADAHVSWLKQKVARKKSALRQQGSPQSKRDVAAIERTMTLLGIDE